jgi:hypothetical protein
MPLNYLEIREQIEQFGVDMVGSAQEAAQALIHLRALLATYANQQDEVCTRVNLTREKHQSLRCGVPVSDAMNQIYDAPLMDLPDFYLLASDGSQIFPDPHGAVNYGLVNTGLLIMRYRGQESPEVISESNLYYPGIPPFDKMDLTEDMISYLRDVEERCLLSETLTKVQQHHAFQHGGELPLMVALTDGPLDLFNKPGNDGMQFRRLFDQYLDALLTIHQVDGLIAGYIERPRASMVVRTLEIMDTAEDLLTAKGQLDRQYPGISDIHLFSEFLKPGQRTGIFRLISNNESDYSNKNPNLGLHFFYLNVGYYLRDGNPMNVFARVEIPAWVAKDRSKIDIIHQVLLDQSKILGTNPYPYLLHRAHETAIVHFAEKEDLDRMMVSQLLANGVDVTPATQKSANKRNSGA